jgi:hypothetical protein
MSRRKEIATLKVGSTIFSTAFAILLKGTPIWPNVGLGACKIIVRARCTRQKGWPAERAATAAGMISWLACWLT